MEIIVAKSGGFCRGVQKAVDAALTVSSENTYIFGEIIHNAEVVKEITDRGIVLVERLEDVPQGATLIIRSHGVGKAVYEECERRGIRVVDCTCEFVRRTQKIIAEQYALGKAIVIIGERTHPEVMGLNGWCEESAYIFSSENENFDVLPPKNCAVVAQTTYSKEKFEKIIKNLNDKRGKTVEVFQTICYTTIGRQNEARELARQCDAMLVLGGLNSSNTNKLYEICKANCSNVFRLSSAAELQYKTIKRFKKVGIVTGASTPNAQTQEVLLKMEMETEAKATSMEEVVANMDNQPKFKKGQLIKATISSADDSGVAVLLPLAKKEIILDKDEVDCEVYNKDDFNAKLGEEIELMVVAINPVKLSQKQIKQIKEEEAALAEIQAGKEFEVVCTGFNKGGLTSELGSYTVFVPAREIRSGYVKELDKYVGKKLRLRLIELKTERRKEIIASQRVIIEEERAAKEAAKAAKEAEFFASIHVDDVVEGKVERVTSFGAFVEVEKGIDGLVHVSQISHEFLENPTTALTIGEEIDAKIMKLDCAEKKMTLSIKALEPKPENVERKPRAAKAEDGEVKEKVRKPRAAKPADEVTEWNEGGLGGVSIADLLNKNS